MMTNKIVRYIVTTLFLLAATVPAFAWDETGHKITAYIAWQRMTPDVRDKVFNILVGAPEDSHISAFYLTYGSRSVESRKREFFMLMATWPDIVRDKNLPVRFGKYHHDDWHYANTFWTWKDGKAEFVSGIEKTGQAMDKLPELTQVLRSNAPASEKAVAIAWLEHIIGDIHQPLHMSGKVSDGNPKGDRGGNAFLLTPKGTPQKEQDNLHRFWDGIIGRTSPNAKDECDAVYVDPIAESIIKRHPFDKLQAKINSEKFDLWASESVGIVTTEVYKDVKWFESPSDKYKKKALAISEERIALAGYRMGDLFNMVFGSAPSSK